MRNLSFGAVAALSFSGLFAGALAVACGITAATSGGTGCSLLSACCPTLPGAELQACVEVTTADVAASCSEELLSLQATGYCGAGVATSTSSSTSAGNSCASLVVCCAAMTGPAATQCESLATMGEEGVCAETLSTYTSLGDCSATTSSSGLFTGTGTGSGGFTGTGTGGFTGTGSGGFTGTGSGFSSFTGTGSATFTGSSGLSGSSGVDAGPPLECTVPATPPSNGSCVTVTPNDAGMGISCNPVTNADCASMGAGYACDVQSSDGMTVDAFVCYPSAAGAGNTQAVCAACDGANGPFCIGGATCAGAGGTTCAKYCCTDADCGAGTCKTGGFGSVAPSLGYCVQ